MSKKILLSIFIHDKIIHKYSKHPSIKLINQNVQINNKFSFKNTSITDIKTEIKNLNSRKSSPANTVSSKNLKRFDDICSKTLHNIISRGIDTGFFDDGMKLADLTPIHKKMLQLMRKIIVTLVVLQQDLKFLNESCINK